MTLSSAPLNHKMSAPQGPLCNLYHGGERTAMFLSHNFLLRALNAKAGGHLTHAREHMHAHMHAHTHAHTYAGKHKQHTKQGNRGEMITLLYADLGLCAFSFTQSFLPGQTPLLCLPLLLPPEGAGGADGGRAVPGPSHQAPPVSARPTPLSSCHRAGKNLGSKT